MTIRSRYYKNQRATIEAPEMQTVEPTISKINRHLNNGFPISFKFLLLTSLTALLFGCNDNATNERSMDYQSDYRRIDSNRDTDPLGAEIYELSNGLKVYLTENHEEPRFYAEIAVRAGSKHDPSDATGLAHYLEHLLFKGTSELGTLDYEAEKPFLEKITALYEEHFNERDEARRAEIYSEINATAQKAAMFAIPNEFDKLYNAMGASGLNAHTSNEETVYKVNLPSNRLDQWASIESARFRDPVFRIFHTELETVYEEKNRSLDNRGFLLYSAVSEQLFKNHPYGQQPTIGTVEHLKNPSLVYIQKYFDTYYVPNNMAIFISGDIDTEDTIELISQNFGDWKPAPLPEVGPWPERPLEGVERRTVQYPGEEQVQLAFRTASNGHADKEALILIDMILDNQTAGLINLNLNQAQKVVSAGSSPQFMNDYGMQMLYGVPKDDQSLEEVENLLLAQIELIKAGDFDEWIIPAIINDFKKSQKASLEFNTARVSMMRQSFIEGTNWDHFSAELTRMQALKKADVIRVANKYFGSDFVSIYQIDAQHTVPSVAKPQIDPVMIDASRQSDYAANLLSMPVKPIEPIFVELDVDYQKIEFRPGIDLYYAPNPLNDLFSFSVNVDVGTEESSKLGLASALLEVAGTNRLSNEQLQKEWYQSGSTFSFGSGENQSSMRLSGLDDQFENSLVTALEVIQDPNASEAVLRELKTILLKSRDDLKSSPQAISRALYLYNRYGNNSPMLAGLTRDEIVRAELRELLALPSSLLSFEHSLSYTGSLSLQQVIEILTNVYPETSNLTPPPPYRFRETVKTESNRLYVVDQKTAQAQVRIEFPDDIYERADTVLANVYTNYFGSGMSSVVFQELREARALAYSASARYSQGARVGAENLMLGAIGTQTDKTVDALDAFVELIDNMPQSTERFEESVNSLLNRYRTAKIGFRDVIGAVRSWERLGIDGDPREQSYKELQSLEFVDLAKFQESHVANKPKLFSVVGDLSIIDVEALERFGEVTQIQINDIFIE